MSYILKIKVISETGALQDFVELPIDIGSMAIAYAVKAIARENNVAGRVDLSLRLEGPEDLIRAVYTDLEGI